MPLDDTINERKSMDYQSKPPLEVRRIDKLKYTLFGPCLMQIFTPQKWDAVRDRAVIWCNACGAHRYAEIVDPLSLAERLVCFGCKREYPARESGVLPGITPFVREEKAALRRKAALWKYKALRKKGLPRPKAEKAARRYALENWRDHMPAHRDGASLLTLDVLTLAVVTHALCIQPDLFDRLE